MEGVKLCTLCKETKNTLLFYVSKNNKNGLSTWCKECVKARTREWSAKNKERKRKADKEYNEKNKEAISEKRKDHYERNRAARIKNSVDWRKRDPSKARKNEAAYREKNRDVCNSRIKAWKAVNRHLVAEYAMRRIAAKRKAFPDWANADKMAEIYKAASDLRKSTGQVWHVDHIVPLCSDYVCGLHCESNLRVIPGKENLRKNNRVWPDMPGV